jgi:hypothetical protein
MSTLSTLLRPVFVALKLLLIGAVAIGALVFGTMVAFTIFIGVTLARLLRGRSETAASNTGERVFDAEYEVVRRPGSGVLTPIERNRG